MKVVKLSDLKSLQNKDSLKTQLMHLIDAGVIKVWSAEIK